MNKNLWVIITTILLFGIVIWEQIFIDNTLDTLATKIKNVSTEISLTENINTEKIANFATDLDKFWTEKEKILCLFINHNDLSKIGEEIKKIKVYIAQNNKDDCENELDVLKFYAESYKHVMEINIQNLL